MSDNYQSSQQPNPTMMGYVAQQMTPRLTTAYLFMFLVHLADFMYFDFTFSLARSAIYVVVLLVVLKGIDTNHTQTRSTLLAMLFIYALFFAIQRFLLDNLFPSLDFMWGEWLQKILFVLLPFILLSMFYKKFTGQNFNPNFGVLAIYYYITFLLPILGEALQSNAIITELGRNMLGMSFQTIIEFLVFGIPAWFWFLNTISSSERLPKFMRTFEIIIFVFIISISLVNNYVAIQDDAPQGGFEANPVEIYWNFLSEGINSAVSAATGEVTQVVNETRSALNFESDVERGAVRDTGMQFSSIDSSQTQYEEGEPLAFFTILESKQFDSDVYAQVSCRFEQKPDGVNRAGLLDTDQNIFVRSYLNYDLSCELPFLPGGERYDVLFNAKFDYVTSSYLRRYFIKEDLMEEFAQSGDPERVFFSQFSISDTSPVSIHTAGPVELAMTTPNVVEPLSFETGERTSFRLRLGIANQRSWDGQIHAINDILLSIPFGFSVKRGGIASGYSCTLGGLESNMTFLSQDDCLAMNDPFKQLDCSNYYHFRITPTSEKARTSIQVDESHSAPQELILGCDIEATNPDEILSGSSFSVDSFRARVAYTYEIEESKSFRVDEREDDGTAIIADETLDSLMYCNQINAYLIEPNYELVFGYVDGKEEEFKEIKAEILDPSTSFASASDRSIITGLGCFERNIFWAHAMQFWDQVSQSSNVGRVYYGYMRTTENMWEYVYTQDSNAVSNPETLTLAEKEKYLADNNILIGTKYLMMMKDKCKTDTTNPQLSGAGDRDVVCAVGKYVCGPDFVYGDYRSCTSDSLCTLCHDRYIPNIVTLATQTEYYDKE